MNYRKNFGLDLIATNVAKRILHTMTLDVVDWINSGFEGNPAFLSNPGGFFLDAVDQVTGKFIFEGGLTGLCSPFEIDIKAALYIGQAGYDKRYACTLGQVINNVQNIPNNVYVNGSNIDGFLGGDFSQGGWPAFIALTTEPQNNPTGAYIIANSELMARINDKRASINIDLNRGNGFLSWNDCTEVKTVQNPDENPEEMETAQQIAINDNSITTKLNDDGSLTYRRCQTATPGSVIAGSVNKSLGAGQDELVAADDINSIINALISTLARTVLTGGLKSFSGGGSGSGNYSSTRYREIIESEYQDNTQTAIDRTQTDSSEQLGYISEIKSYYDKAVEALNVSKNAYLEAKSCFGDKLTSTRENIGNASYQISIIDARLTREVNPLLNSMLKKQANAQTLYNNSQFATTTVSTSDSIDTIQQQSETNALQYASLVGINQSTVITAKTDWENAVTKSNSYNIDAQRLLNQCRY
jgi:hypothetical protein